MDKRRRGLTLAQLILSIGAMMAMVAILIPVLKQQVARGYAVRCRDNLGRIHRGLSSYRNDNDGWWPEKRIHTQAGLVMEHNPWVELVADARYVNAIDVFVCPNDANTPSRNTVTSEYYARSVTRGPSYGLNELTWREYGVSASDDPGIRRTPSRQDTTILLADRGPDLGLTELPKEERERRQVIEFARDAGRLPAGDDFRIGTGRVPRSWLGARHANNINVVAMVGSATPVSFDATALASSPPEPYYDDCATGTGRGFCTFCNVFRAPHYDFSSSQLYFWTGPYYEPTGPLLEVP
jgi:hypothetical protein